MTNLSWPRFHTGIMKGSINLQRDYEVLSNAVIYVKLTWFCLSMKALL